MPSKSYQLFHKNLMDIQRLLDNHKTLSGQERGKKALDHITRSGILLLVATWEVYIEELICESVGFLSKNIRDPNDLPVPVKKFLSDCIHNSKNEIEPFKLAGRGWSEFYREQAGHVTNALNTPKIEKIDKLFKDLLGVNIISRNFGLRTLNLIISTRGDIAHRVKLNKYVKPAILRGFMEDIRQYVLETDKAIYEHLTDLGGKTPWKNQY